MDEDEDDEYGVYVVQAHKLSIWTGLSALCELLGNTCQAVGVFWDAMSTLCLAHFRFKNGQREMHDQATAEIEMLTKEV